MRVRRLAAVARKEAIQIMRDPRSLIMGIAIPMVMLFLFGFALTLDIDNVPIAVWDRSRSQASRELASRFALSRYFKLVRFVDDYPSLEAAVDRREAILALVIPYDFAGRIESGREAEVQMIADASDSNTATLAIAYAEAVVSGFSTNAAVKYLRRTRGSAVAIPVEMRARVWFNQTLSSRNYIIPGLIAVIMMVIASLLTSLTIAREWERGTMEQLIATPVKGPELIVGKLIPYFAIGIFDVAAAVVAGTLVFGVPLRGSIALLFVMSSVFLAGALSMGILMSIVTKSQLVASQLAMVLTFLPAFLLSGFTFPIINMPPAIKVVTYLIPARYFVELLKGIFLKGVGLRTMWAPAVLLTVFAAAMVALSNVIFKKRLE